MPLISRLSSITIVWLYILAIIVPVIAPSIPNIGNNLSNIGNSIGNGVNQIGDLFFPPVQTSPPSSIPSQSNNNSSTNTTYFSPTPPTVLPMPRISLADFRNIKEFSVPKLVGKVRTTFGADNMAVRLVKAEPGKVVFDIEDYVAPNIPRKLAFQMQALKSLLKSDVVGAVYVNGAPTTHYEADLLGEKWLIVEVPHLSTITITATVGSNVTTETQIISLEDFANFTQIAWVDKIFTPGDIRTNLYPSTVTAKTSTERGKLIVSINSTTYLGRFVLFNHSKIVQQLGVEDYRVYLDNVLYDFQIVKDPWGKKWVKLWISHFSTRNVTFTAIQEHTAIAYGNQSFQIYIDGDPKNAILTIYGFGDELGKRNTIIAKGVKNGDEILIPSKQALPRGSTVTFTGNSTYDTGSFVDTFANFNNLSVFNNVSLGSVKLSYTGPQLDNSGGGEWSRSAGFVFTSSTTEYAHYKLEINGTTWELYDVADTLEGSIVVTDFWNLVQADGDDIRVFDNNNNQLYFMIDSWNYTSQQATIWVNVSSGVSEVNVAFGNPSAVKSNYNDPQKTSEVYDDFEDGVFDATYWRWTRAPTTYDEGSTLAGWLTISADGTDYFDNLITGSLANMNVLYHNTASDVIVEAKLKGNYDGTNLQQAGIILVQDDLNAFAFLYSDEGANFYWIEYDMVAGNISNNGNYLLDNSVPSPFWMRVSIRNGTHNSYYSTDGVTWVSPGPEQSGINVTGVGIVVNKLTQGQIDYIRAVKFADPVDISGSTSKSYQYNSSGYIVSRAINTSYPVTEITYTYFQSVPAGTSISHNISVNNGVTFFTPLNATKHLINYDTQNTKIIYKVNFTTTQPDITPSLNKIKIDYVAELRTGYPAISNSTYSWQHNGRLNDSQSVTIPITLKQSAETLRISTEVVNTYSSLVDVNITWHNENRTAFNYVEVNGVKFGTPDFLGNGSVLIFNITSALKKGLNYLNFTQLTGLTDMDKLKWELTLDWTNYSVIANYNETQALTEVTISFDPSEDLKNVSVKIPLTNPKKLLKISVNNASYNNYTINSTMLELFFNTMDASYGIYQMEVVSSKLDVKNADWWITKSPHLTDPLDIRFNVTHQTNDVVVITPYDITKNNITFGVYDAIKGWVNIEKYVIANSTHIIIPTEIVARYQHSPAQFRITEEYLPPADKPDTRGAFYIPVLPVIKIQSVDPYEALLEFIMSYWWMILTFILLIVGGILILKE